MEMKMPHHKLRSLAEAYIKGEATSDDATWFEACITSDDSALELYIQTLADMEEKLPTLKDPEVFANQLVGHADIIPYRRAVPHLDPDRPKRWYERAIFHYSIAASITMLFMFSGAFDRLLQEDTELVPSHTEVPSYSEQWVDTTTGWLDQLLTR